MTWCSLSVKGRGNSLLKSGAKGQGSLWIHQSLGVSEQLEEAPHPEAEARGWALQGHRPALPGSMFGLTLPFLKVQVLTPEPSIFGVQQQSTPLSEPSPWSPIFVPWAMGQQRAGQV